MILFLSVCMFNIVLVEPQIPPNTGNVIRLCANTGCHLHLIEPMGFPLDDSKMRRAGLDYHEFASVHTYASFDAFINWQKNTHPQAKLYVLTTKGSDDLYAQKIMPQDCLIFGSETAGLNPQIRQQADAQIRLPMLPQQRSLNLANTVAIVVYEAWRQNRFAQPAQ